MRILTPVAALVCTAALSVGTVQAADVGYGYPDQGYAQPYAAPVSYDWTGLYIGGQIGYGFGDSDDIDADGLFGGVTAGGNWQWDQLVVGLEGDLSLAGIGYDGIADSYDADWVGTLRGRIGYAFDRFMIYGTGGFAWASAEYDDGAFSDENTHVGWTAGAGVEAAITEHISAKAEYLYMDLSSETYAVTVNQDIDPDLHTIKLGVNYRF